MHSLFDSNKDDMIVAESGYQMYDLVPNVKHGPIGRINVTVVECFFANNFGGIRSIYRYHEYSNSLWHYEIRNNRVINNKQSFLKLYLPRIYRFATKNSYENTSHTIILRNNEFSNNDLFEISIDGYYAQLNITKNLFIDNKCRIGLFKLAGTEKDFFIYLNHFERNEANYIFDLDAKSHADNDFDYPSLFVDNIIEQNRRLNDLRFNNEQTFRDAASLFVQNSPSAYAIAIRGVQNCSFHRNLLQNENYDYEFVGAMTTNTLNSTIDATLNWWGSMDANTVKQRIFDIHEWNNHALVNFVPYYSNKIDYSLSRAQPDLNLYQNLEQNVLGGLIKHDLSLSKKNQPYQVRADLTIMPGATLYIGPGVEMEFYPNVGILVLGDLKASGTLESTIKMRPVRMGNNRMPYYSSKINFENNNDDYKEQHYFNYETKYDPSYLNSSKRLRFFEGLKPNEGFLQIYNATLRSWTMICDPQFTLTTASIVCKQMGKEYRNALVKSLFYYMTPELKQPIWNQTFICTGGEQTLGECDNYANYHIDECRARGEYIYVSCNSYDLDGYENSWGGIRFAQPYFETYNQPNQFGLPETPIYLKPEMQQIQPDNSFMYYVDLIGAGRLHNEQSPSLQLIHRTPLISYCNIMNSTYHGLDFLQSKSTMVLNKLKIQNSLGYGVNSLQLNVQTTDQKSSFSTIAKNTLSNSNLFSLIDLCDPNKYYSIDQRVIVYYKYSSLARDCVKIFRTRLSQTNLGASGQIGLRFLQVMLVNNTVLNDTIEIYNGTLFKQDYLMTLLTNASSQEAFDKFYLSRSDSLSVYMRASAGREFYGFIAEVLVYPTAQYLLPDTYIELSDSDVSNSQLGALSYVTAGERNPNFYLIRNRFTQNGFQYFNWTTLPTVDLILQNTPKFYFGNNYIAKNWGGVTVNLYSGSGVLITSSVIFNNLFYANQNDTILCTKGNLQLPYNELTIDKNLFIENETPRTDLVLVSGLISKFTRNQLVYNKGMRILFTQGFENVSTPRHQDITFNLMRDNYAYGIHNELEDANRFRSTMVAASLKQVYYANYLFNKDNDFELTALTDPLSLAFLQNYYSSTIPPPYFWNELYDKKVFDKEGFDKAFFDRSNYFKSQYDQTGEYGNSLLDKSKYAQFNPDLPYPEINLNDVPNKKMSPSSDWTNFPGLVAHAGAINASYNYWGTRVDTEIRARIRDKYDNGTLFEVAYSPAASDEFTLRDGKCELGWSLIDDTCYTYIGSYVTYKEAESSCKKFESRLARETVAPIKLPRFRKLARSSQFDYEAQSYRRMWLYTDFLIGSDSNKCTVIDDFGQASTNCDEFLPFICEKDPVFLGAAFRFKDEVAFAIAAIAALLVCILLLSILWVCKSRRRKKEHIDRQNTLRNSARTHRHMINNSGFSTMTGSSSMNQMHKSSSSALYGITGNNNNSVDNMSSNRSISRSTTTGIYNSQRNQYFASKRFKKGGDSANNLKSNDDSKSIDNESQENKNASKFIGTGLDSHAEMGIGIDYYGGINEENEIISNKINNSNVTSTPSKNKNENMSIQYHMYDSNDNNQTKSSEDDEDEDTTTDELTDDTAATKQNSGRFKALKHSPNSQSSGKTTETFADNHHQNLILSHEKQFIQAKLVKQPPPIGTNPTTIPPALSNKFMSSYDQLMNTTITDNEDDNDANSRRLLTNKIQTSNINIPSKTTKKPTYFTPDLISSPLQPNYQTQFISTANLIKNNNTNNNNNNNNNNYNQNNSIDLNTSANNNNISTFTTASVLSKSTTVLTNVSALSNNNNNNYNNNNNFEPSSRSSSDYENLSNAEIDDAITTYPNGQQTHININMNPSGSIPKRNIFIDKDGNNLMQRVSLNAIPPIEPPPPPPPVQLLTQFTKINETPRNQPPPQTLPKPSLNAVQQRFQHLFAQNNIPSSSETDATDAESVMSCQLITSASLLLNRGPQFQVREAKKVVDNSIMQPVNQQSNQQNIIVPQARRQMPMNASNRNLPPLNPRNFITNNNQQQQFQPQIVHKSDEYTQTNLANQPTTNQPDPMQNLDPSKPPPMETAI